MTSISACGGGFRICEDADPFLQNVPPAFQRRLRDIFGNVIPSSVLLGGLPASVDKTQPCRAPMAEPCRRRGMKICSA